MTNKILDFCLVLLTVTSGCTLPTSTTNPLSTIKNLNPDIKKICPANPQVSINELGLPENLVLLAVQDDEILGGNLGTTLNSDMLSYSGESSTPSKIEGIRTSDVNSKIINILVSPGGSWLAIFRWDANNNHETLWVSTLDGKKHWFVADISPRQRVYWISENEILVAGVPNETDYEGRIPEEEMRPLLNIDPLTLEKHFLEPFPEDAIYVYNSYHSRNGNHYSIFYKEDSQRSYYFLYDYAKKTSTQIFRWVDLLDPTIGVGVRSNGLYYVARRVEDGVDFAMNLNFDHITNNLRYSDVMKHLSNDYTQGLEFSTMFTWAENDIPLLTSDPLDDQKDTSLYILDYAENILKDYCINLGQTTADFSPNEEFAAFTVYEGIENPGYYVLVLNLKTGNYSVINDTKAIGFGITN